MLVSLQCLWRSHRSGLRKIRYMYTQTVGNYMKFQWATDSAKSHLSFTKKVNVYTNITNKTKCTHRFLELEQKGSRYQTLISFENYNYKLKKWIGKQEFRSDLSKSGCLFWPDTHTSWGQFLDKVMNDQKIDYWIQAIDINHPINHCLWFSSLVSLINFTRCYLNNIVPTTSTNLT
jgi:hypothetical protein